MTARRVYELTRCRCLDKQCQFFRYAYGEIPPENLTEHLRLSSLPDKLYAVVTKAAHREAFDLHDGSIESLAPNPCSNWRKFISRLYREGFRYVHFEVNA